MPPKTPKPVKPAKALKPSALKTRGQVVSAMKKGLTDKEIDARRPGMAKFLQPSTKELRKLHFGAKKGAKK